MADILCDTQTVPSAPSSGKVVWWPDSSSNTICHRNASGAIWARHERGSVAQQAGFSSDTYLTNSGLIIPSCSMVAGMMWIWRMVITKTAAGTAQPVWQVRIGANQSTSDTSRLSITTAAQTAAADTAFVTVTLTCRNVGASGVLQGAVWIQHNLAATGFANTPAGFNLVQGASSGFDNSALGGQFIGLSINGGASAAWTIEQVMGRMAVG